MPFTAIKDGSPVSVFQFKTDNDWLVYKASKPTGLTMACCGADAVCKTSRLGTPFFAHKKNTSGCETAPESAEHQYLKWQLGVELSKLPSWTVTPEKSGVTPSGEPWRADVFAENGERKVAFEIQLSPQADIEYMRRTKKYQESGVEVIWLAGHKNPASIQTGIENGFIRLDHELNVAWLELAFFNSEPKLRQVNACALAANMLSKNIEVAQGVSGKLIVTSPFKTSCCQADTRLITSIKFGEALKAGNWVLKVTDYIGHYNVCLEMVEKYFSNEMLKEHGVAEIGYQKNEPGMHFTPNYRRAQLCSQCGETIDKTEVSKHLDGLDDLSRYIELENPAGGVISVPAGSQFIYVEDLDPSKVFYRLKVQDDRLFQIAD